MIGPSTQPRIPEGLNVRWIPLIVSIALFPLSAGAEATIVVYAGEPASTEMAGRVAQMLALLEPPIELAAPPLHLDEIASPEALVAVGAADASSCMGEAVDKFTYQAGLVRLHEAVWEVDDLAPVFSAARGSQSCLQQPVGPASLARVSFIQGVMAFEVGDEDVARAAFREVFGVDPAFPWDGQFGPGAQTIFEEMRAEVTEAPRIALEVVGNTGASIWLDGRLLDATTAEVVAGPHLVQVGASAGADVRSLLVVVGDQPVTVVDGASLRSATGPEFEARFERSLTMLLAGRPQDASWAVPGYLVFIGEEPRVWSWDGTSLQPMDVPRTAQIVLSPPQDGGRKRVSPAVPILISIGAGLLAGGTVLAVASKKDLDEFHAGVESGELWPFPGPDEGNPRDFPLYAQWQGKRNRLGVGYAMIAVGGVSLLASIPVAAVTRRSQGKKVVLGASLLTGDAPRGIELDGFMLFVALR